MASELFLGMLQTFGGLRRGHFALRPDLHSDTYVDHKVLFPHTAKWQQLARALAGRFDHQPIDMVVGLRLGEPSLCSLVGNSLQETAGRNTVIDIETGTNYACRLGEDMREQIERMAERRILLITDVLRTGLLVKNMVTMIHHGGGHVVGVGTLCNCGNVAAADLGLTNGHKLKCLAEIRAANWATATCPLCQQNNQWKDCDGQ